MTKEDKMNTSKSKDTPSKDSRKSNRQKKSINYAALHDVKIEHDDEDSDIEDITPPPAKKPKHTSSSRGTGIIAFFIYEVVEALYIFTMLLNVSDYTNYFKAL